MKKFEDIWKKANEEADSKYEPRGTLAWGVFLKEALEKRIEPLLEKQQPEIPEFVAKAVMEINLGYLFNGFTNGINKKAKEWLEKHKGAKSLGYYVCQLRFQGFTVAKEKRFYLKNKLTGLNLVEEKTFSLTGKHVGERFREFEMQYIPTDEQEARLYKNTFTQQEIDSMETGSYEQIEVQE